MNWDFVIGLTDVRNSYKRSQMIPIDLRRNETCFLDSVRTSARSTSVETDRRLCLWTERGFRWRRFWNDSPQNTHPLSPRLTVTNTKSSLHFLSLTSILHTPKDLVREGRKRGTWPPPLGLYNWGSGTGTQILGCPQGATTLFCPVFEGPCANRLHLGPAPRPDGYCDVCENCLFLTER